MLKQTKYFPCSFEFQFISLFLVFLLFVNNLSAQLILENVDCNRIPQRKIKNFIERQKRTGHKLFSDLIPKCYIEKDSVLYHKVSSSYIIHGNADDVWNEYLSAQPSSAYSGKIVGFGFLYNRDEDEIFYKEDRFDKMKVGQLFFFNIKLLGGIRNLAIADEVTAIDENLKTIRFCYIQNGKTEGTQEIHLKNTSEGYTEITHDTWYKSKSRFRDNRLYPFFHNRSVDEYHQIIREQFERSEELLSGVCPDY